MSLGYGPRLDTQDNSPLFICLVSPFGIHLRVFDSFVRHLEVPCFQLSSPHIFDIHGIFINEQHIWGGAQLGPLPGNTSDSREQQMTNIVHRTTCFSEPPQGGFVASYSDNLFHPTSQIPSSNTFTLPNVPFNPNPRYSLRN